MDRKLIALQMANKAHHDLCMGAPCAGDRQRILIDLDLIMDDLRRERR